MESNVIRKLFSTTCESGRNTKKAGGTRTLGIPTVADRIAQMTVKLYFEPTVEPFFHVDSYGYRPREVVPFKQ